MTSMIIPYMKWTIKHVWNHQAAIQWILEVSSFNTPSLAGDQVNIEQEHRKPPLLIQPPIQQRFGDIYNLVQPEHLDNE